MTTKAQYRKWLRQRKAAWRRYEEKHREERNKRKREKRGKGRQ